MESVTLTAPDIHCDGCARSIARSLGGLPGVGAVEVDIAAKRVRVEYDGATIDEAAIRSRLADAGFPAEA
ncbi:MAG: heavy-metal-associated domain-containing protein [Chthonomonadales bacterium]|nr:heavy-metal-associated domain-containing protein [Chthonomonadales bacterium]